MACSSELPYVIFPEHNIKILIDSGSTKSFLDPNFVNKFYPNFISNDPFIVSTVYQKSAHQFSANIPSSKLFNLPYHQNLKFYLFKFHDFFDGLLGIDNLKLLRANLDFGTGFLVTPHVSIKLRFHKTQPQINCITIPPRVQQVIKIPTSIKHGEIIISHQKIQNCEIPECLTSAKNGFALTTILNNTTQPVTLDFSAPFYVEKFQRNEIREINLNNFNDSLETKIDFSKFRTDHLNSEEKNKLLQIIAEFSDIFYHENSPLTFTSKIKHQIKTSDEIPIYTKSYRYPFIHKKEVETQIQKMLDQNIVQPSSSPWSSPIWVVPKKMDASGKQKWRVVVDYRSLNSKTIDDRYPLPNITDLLDKLGKCQYFSTLDLASGFHQIEMAQNDIEKTAFSTENGHFEYLRMPFGLKNAPATFQRVMDNILRGIQNEHCLVYLDDIIVYSTSLQEHLKKLRLVFERLRESNFKIQLDKSEFLKKEVAYLGHVVTPQGVKPNPDKIRAIKEFPLMSTTKQIKGFLGLIGYYRKFIKDFAKLTKPLTKCLKKGAKIVHNQEFLTCFETCKNILTNEPILQYPDFNKPFNLTTDASNVALGAILSQGPIGQDLPIAYASRTLNDSESHYSTIERELLAIVWATKYFRPYLFGRKFSIITDHKPLQWLFSLKDPTSKLLRWRIKLEEFDYDIIYKSGKSNTNADALSRIELHIKETDNHFSLKKYIEDFNKELEESERPDDRHDKNLDLVSNIAQADEMSTHANDERHETISHDLDRPADDDVTVHTNEEEDPIVGIPIIETAVNYGANQIIISKVFHSPAKPKTIILFEKKRRILAQLSENNFENDIINLVKEKVVPEKLYYLYFENPELYEPFCEVIRKTFKYPSLRFKKCTIKLLDVTNKDDIPDIIKNYHESKTNHRGIDETESKIKSKYYWPNLKNSIQTLINQCEICQKSKYERHPIKMQMNITPTSSKPFEILHIDTYTLENSKFLTITDSFSKYAQAYYLKSLNATEIADNLLLFFSHHGLPELITFDNGTEFKNNVITELLLLHKLKIHFGSPHHPASNGIVERMHSTLAEHVRLLNNQGFSKSPITHRVTYAILAYNHTIHSVTKMKPIDVINGHISNNDPFNQNLEQLLLSNYVSEHKEKSKLLYSKINEKLLENKTKLIGKLNEKRDTPDLFQPDQVVYIRKHERKKLADKFSKPTEIKSVNPERKTITTETHGKIHMDNLKKPLRNTYSFD